MTRSLPFVHQSLIYRSAFSNVYRSRYKAPSSDVVLLSPAEVAVKPQDATWMLVDKDE